MYTGIAILVNNMEVPKKTKNKSCHMMQKSYSCVYIHRKLIWKDTYTPTFIAALFSVAPYMEATLMSIDRWIYTADEVYIRSGILCHKKWNGATCSHMGGPRDCHAKHM